MISNLLFLALLCSGSVFAAAWTKTRFEEVLPITAMSVVLLVFVFGIAGHLYAGVVFCAIAAVILWLLALIYIIWKKDFKAFISAFITPASVLFVALFFFLSVCNFDRLVGAEFDEYHHWADIVKVMTILDDFGTNAASNSMFASYPPAMAIFQYFFQKIYLLTNQDGVFSEWRLYLAYQLFCYIPLFPFLRNCSLKKPLVIVLYCAAFFVSPLIFFDRLYVNTLIDPFIGFLSGAGLARVLLCNKKNLLYSVYIWMLCATLTISKDAGLMFSLFLVVAYCIDHVIQNVSARDQKPERKNFAKNLVFISAAMATALLPKLLWVIELKLSKTYIQFSGKINFKQLVFILLGKDNTYRSDVWKTYIITQFSHPYQFGTLSLPFFAVTLLTLIGFYWLCRIYKKKWPEKRKNTLAIFAVATIEIFVYLFGMGVMYMFKFSEEEALDLACMSRYLNIVFLSSWILIVTACIYAIDHWCSSRAFTLTALCLLLIISPLTVVANFLNGYDRNYAYAFRYRYKPLSEWVEQNCDGNQRFWVISQNQVSIDRSVVHFVLRPNFVTLTQCWDIREEVPEGDSFPVQFPAEEWHKELVENYDYVVIYSLDESFYDDYSVVFEDPKQISENTLYAVDRNTGLLTKCCDIGCDYGELYGMKF